MIGLIEEQLPVVMAADANLVRLVRVVDPISSELYDRVGDKDVLFHPATAPPAIVRWLAGLLAMPLSESVTPDHQRLLVAAAAAQYAHRGTARSLEALLGVLTQAPVVVDDGGGGRAARVHRKPRVAQDRWRPPDAVDRVERREPPVIIRVGRTDASAADLRSLVERELPADLTYVVVVHDPLAADPSNPEVTP